MRLRVGAFALALALGLAGCGAAKDSSTAGPLVVRIGHFPNITHAQGLVAHALSRQGRGWFEERLGSGVTLQWYVYNAGPSAMEAFFAGSLDLSYVGPNPALNAYMKSRGEAVRIVAGAALGGAAMVVHADGPLHSPSDFRGRRIGTPQLGNTQDVACRSWLASHGFQVTQLGGDVSVIPTANPDQLALFQSGGLDAVWTVEPWVSRLEMEAGARVFLEEADSITTVLAARTGFLQESPAVAARFVAAHRELTAWIAANPDEARRLVAEELAADTMRPMSDELLARSWGRLRFTSDISLDQLSKFVEAARAAGFMRDDVDLGRLVEIPR